MTQADVSREEVHEALSHLYDNDLLGQSLLASRFPGLADLPLGKRADRLRALLLEAIEVLRPSRRCAFGSLESRHYDVLCLRYVEDMPATRMAEELSLGRRQVHRDLLEAEFRLAEVLAARIRADELKQQPRQAASGRAPEPTRGPGGTVRANDPLSDELMVLRSQPAVVDMLALLRSALKLLAPLAERTGANIEAPVETGAIYVTADPAILRQLIIQLIGFAIQLAPHGQVPIDLQQSSDGTSLTIGFPALDGAQLASLKEAQRIALSQRIQCEIAKSANGKTAVHLHFQGSSPFLVLVVEDNPGAVELYRRYLEGSGWRVHSTSDPRLASALARSHQPDAIILDIMMPGLDGWSVIESLSSSPATAAIPILICSVVQDIHLGEALGVKAYLKKPVARGELLAALNQCLPQR